VYNKVLVAKLVVACAEATKEKIIVA